MKRSHDDFKSDMHAIQFQSSYEKILKRRKKSAKKKLSQVAINYEERIVTQLASLELNLGGDINNLIAEYVGPRLQGKLIKSFNVNYIFCLLYYLLTYSLYFL